MESQGLTVEEEAVILRLEDRREFDPALAESWIRHPNAQHRARMALALGRIGTATFIDKEKDQERDADERMAGVELLATMTGDPDYNVRRNAAFALGEIGDPAAIDALFAYTRDPDHADVSAEAVEALSKLAASVPLERYEQLILDEREGVRARALRYLFRFARDEASALAAQYLDDSNLNVKREAVYSLARRAFASARTRLELLLNDSDILTRSYAARALGLIAAPESVTALVGALSDLHPWVRTNALRSLGQIGEKSALPAIPDHILRIDALTNDPDPGTRAEAVLVLGYYASRNEIARARLVALSASGSPWIREQATLAMFKHLGESRGFSDSEARWVKIRGLEGSAALSAGPTLRQRIFNDADASVRAAAIGAIPDPRVDAELALIKRGMEDADAVVRSNAIDRYALQRIDPQKESLELLRQAEQRSRNDALNDARLSAIQALSNIDYPEREQFLRGLLSDRDPVVRRIAAEAIEQKLKKLRPQYTPLPVDRPLSEYAEVVRWARDPHSAAIYTGRGKIELILVSREAPLTAKNFADLAQRGYFNGTSFMRVVPNFVIQGGDPRNDQSGGPGYSIRDEINLQKYTRGAVGMALSGPDTGGSQFFITHSPQPHLDGGYTIFGRVTGGMSGVVDLTERGDTVEKITIDEIRPSPTADLSAIESPPLPHSMGSMTAERMLASVPEYARRKGEYEPDRDVVQMMSTSIRPDDRLEVYLGTWCDDSQREVPKLLKLIEALRSDYGIDLPVSYVAVNRAKKEPSDLIEGKDIEKVATFIYYRGNQELGRIVEKPIGVFEDDLLQIIAREQ